eukprot:CAMPEP_0117652624 /NCGR_PEP_ID=MMETSP0804-20121206/2729_1 /TAXON_ID=1074897 /ORGANISM="Tetraselmis astigmatica, Strain CCMP880" /LENGTH=139 /DNA_ID=CAMNT_0005458689 /DNA_START=430 /DNA_END=849 /DNA_ORIENTATION=-
MAVDLGHGVHKSALGGVTSKVFKVSSRFTVALEQAAWRKVCEALRGTGQNHNVFPVFRGAPVERLVARGGPRRQEVSATGVVHHERKVALGAGFSREAHGNTCTPHPRAQILNLTPEMGGGQVSSYAHLDGADSCGWLV